MGTRIKSGTRSLQNTSFHTAPNPLPRLLLKKSPRSISLHGAQIWRRAKMARQQNPPSVVQIRVRFLASSTRGPNLCLEEEKLRPNSTTWKSKFKFQTASRLSAIVNRNICRCLQCRVLVETFQTLTKVSSQERSSRTWVFRLEPRLEISTTPRWSSRWQQVSIWTFVSTR